MTMHAAEALLALLLGANQASEDSDATRTDSGTVLIPRATVERLDSPRWIRHRVTSRERLSQIAARYGVKKKHLLQWNALAPDAASVRTGRRLRVKARLLPPPRKRINYAVREWQSWREIAAQFLV